MSRGPGFSLCRYGAGPTLGFRQDDGRIFIRLSLYPSCFRCSLSAGLPGDTFSFGPHPSVGVKQQGGGKADPLEPYIYYLNAKVLPSGPDLLVRRLNHPIQYPLPAVGRNNRSLALRRLFYSGPYDLGHGPLGDFLLEDRSDRTPYALLALLRARQLLREIGGVRYSVPDIGIKGQGLIVLVRQRHRPLVDE